MLHGNILVVDDTLANLQVLTTILRERGHRVRAVTSGSMGIIAAETDPPDVILLDIRMPDMDGYAVCEALKTDPALSAIPVIFISALEETIDKVRAFNIGGADYITKPFQVEEVVARVESQMARAILAQQAAAQVAQAERARLARDLHDAVSQTLFSVSMSAETLLMQYDNQPDQIRPGLAQIVELSQTALAEMRILLFELRPDVLDKADLAEMLDNAVRAARGQTRATVELHIVESPADLPPHTKRALYRIAQEGLHNAVKHARATTINLSLDARRLRIVDDGRGFDPNSPNPGRLGLISMVERAADIGTQLIVNSVRDEGTTIEVTYDSRNDRG